MLLVVWESLKVLLKICYSRRLKGTESTMHYSSYNVLNGQIVNFRATHMLTVNKSITTYDKLLLNSLKPILPNADIQVCRKSSRDTELVQMTYNLYFFLY